MNHIRNKTGDFKSLLIVLLFFFYGQMASAQLPCGQNIDFNTWSQEGVLASGSWNVLAGGSTVQQNINGNPTWFVSPNDFFNVLIEGSFQVNTASDDDMIGFVFGYQDPIGALVTPNNTYVKTFLFDWKQATQVYVANTGFEGFSLMELDGMFDFVNTGPTGIFQLLWNRVTTATTTVLDNDYANNGWVDFQQYNFQLKYTSDSIVIWIDNVKIFEETGCYEPGRFGFYNLSQGAVNYSNFSYNIEYDFEMSDSISCINNNIDLEIGSGCLATLPPQTTFNWNFGDGTTATGPNPSHIYTTPGSYDLQLFSSDLYGCIDTSTQTIEILAYPVSNAGIDDTSCTLSYNLMATPPTGSWSGPPGVIFSSVDSANSLVTVPSVGTYTFTWEAINAGGCIHTDDVTILFNDPSVTAVLTDPSCFNGDDGEIQLSVQDLVGPLSYQWDASANNQITSTATNLSASSYLATITNPSGCVIDSIFTLTEPADFNFSIALTPSDCDNGTGSATISTIGGGTGPYTYDWGAGPTATNNEQNIPLGTYNVTIADFNGCDTTFSYTILPNPFMASISSFTNALCLGANDGTATAAGPTPMAVYTYQWGISSGSQTTATATNLSPGTHTVTVSTANGCSDIVTVDITEPTALTYTIALTPSDCDTGTGSATISAVSGGTGPYTYDWGAGPTATNNEQNIPLGTYNVTITDFNGCDTTFSYTILPNPFVASISAFTNSTCFGANNGTATVSGPTPMAAYTYQWGISSGSQTTATATNLSPGTHTVTVSTANGCSDVVTVDITEPTALTYTIALTPSDCDTGTGSATISTVSGGTGPYTYDWGAGPTATNNEQNIPLGTYNVTITDFNGCDTTFSYTILPNPFMASISSFTNALCFGANDGTATAAGPTPMAAYTYQWGISSGSQTTPTATNLSPGTHTVTVSTANGCSDVVTVDITEPTALTYTIALTPSDCDNGTGSATISTIGGGTGPYTYDWGAGPTATNNEQNIPLGTYSMTITDFNGCDTTFSYTILPNPFVASISAFTNALCFGADDGTATASGPTPMAAYTYLWGASAGSQTTATATNLSPGTHTVTVSTANGCSDDVTVTIDEPAALAYTIALTLSDCDNGTGSATISTIGGGTGPYTYDWGAGPTSTNNDQNIPLGTYNVTITDFNGCDTTFSYTILPNPFVASISSFTNTLCIGSNDGTATVAGPTPMAVYTYQWGISSGSQTTATATNLSPGTHTVTVSTANGCSDIVTVDITEPTALTYTIALTPSDCDNGTGSATISTIGGGTGPYTYDWGAGPTATNNEQNIPLGTYSMTITDFNGCDTTFSYTILPNPFVASISAFTNALCFGADDGTATASGPTPMAPYTYSWGASAGSQTTVTATNLSPGMHTVTVSTANGCSDDVTVTIDEPAALAYTIALTPSDCDNGTGSATISNVTGGTAPYTYDWGAGPAATNNDQNIPLGTYNVTITDFNGCDTTFSYTILPNPFVASIASFTDALCLGANDGTATAAGPTPMAAYTYLWGASAGSQTTATATNLSPGTHTVTVSTANGCSDDVTVTIDEPAALAYTIALTLSDCDNGTGSATISTIGGGTGPYTYDWGAGPTATNNDQNIPLGTYNVTITDFNGCDTTFSYTILPNPFVASISSFTNTLCIGSNDGTATVAGPTPMAAYTYQWGISSGSQTTATATNLSSGTHTVTVSTANGCSDIVTVDITEPTALTYTIALTPSDCDTGTGSATISAVSGGTAPYTYDWGAGPTATNNEQNIPLGTYNVTITDFNGCDTTFSYTILPNPFMASISSFTNTLCLGANDGTATAAGPTPMAAYTYQWGISSGSQTTATATNLSPGTHTVTVSTANGCSDVVTVDITEPTALTYTIALTPSDCDTGTGSATISTVSGGTGPYTYDWGAGPTATNNEQNIPLGTYNVTITDFNGCDTTFSYTILPNPFVASISSFTNTLCIGSNDGTATVAGPTPMAAYTYQWGISSGSQTTATATNLSPGTHTVTVSTANGCSDIVTVDITEPTALTYTIALTPSDCDTGTGSATISTVSGGTGPYTYDWGAGPTATNNEQNIPLGTYNVTITDFNGCDTTFSYTILPNPFMASITSFTNALCFGANNGTATVSGPTPMAAYTYQWGISSGSQTTPTATNLSPGTHTVTVSTANGCSDVVTVMITEPSQLVITQTSNSSVCIGTSAVLSATVAGGTAPYSYFWGGGIGAVQNPTVAVNQAELYSITVTDGNGCTVTDNASVDILGTPIASFLVDTLYSCIEPLHEFTFSNTSTPPGLSATWNFGDLSVGSGDFVTHTYLNSGLYSVSLTITDGMGCTVTHTEPNLITVSENPIADFNYGPNSITTFSSTVNFTDQSYNNIVAWNWDFDGLGSSTSENPNYTFPTTAGAYLTTLEVTNAEGCVDTVSEEIVVTDDMNIFAPNAFTPDGDEFNQNWRIYSTGFDLFDMEITLYNRWGEVIWKSFDIEVPWDGTFNGVIVPNGVYSWSVKTKSITNDETFEFNGHVVVLR